MVSGSRATPGVETSRGIEVGTASVNWGFDPLYRWVRTPSFERMLDEMETAGYAGTEISYNFPTEIAVLRTALQEHNLRAASTFQTVDVRDAFKHESELEKVERVADRLQQLGSDVLILSDQPTPARLAIAGRVRADGSDGLTDHVWNIMATGLQRIGERLAQRQMKAVFHPHVGTYVETRQEIDRLCRLTDPALIGLCPDTGHLAYAGANVEDIFRDYASRIAYVHLKDVDGDKLNRVRSEKFDFVRAVEMGLFVELGTGMVSLDSIMRDLNKGGYRGWIVVEQDAPRDPLDAAARNRRYLRENFGL